ncbi:MAG: class B sortase [Eubacteriales bacterium]|nr:class B sortase [Eubacteriales bacterium]
MKTWKLIVLMLCCSLIGVCGKYLYDYFSQSAENKEAYENILDIGFSAEQDDPESEEETESAEGQSEVEANDFDYNSILAINSDCIGWIRIDGTDIDYPIVQAADNSYYLYHNFNQASAICGAIFLDYRNDIDLTREHLILYGHQMKDGSMFKQLNGYKDRDFYENHPRITLYLRNQKYNYDVVSVYVTDIADSGSYYNYLHGDTREAQIEYLQKKMAAYQLYDTGLTVTKEDELLSLSTCEYSSANGRLIVLARRSENEKERVQRERSKE